MLSKKSVFSSIKHTLLCILLCVPVLSMSAAEFKQRLEWKTDKNVLEYQVEIQPASGKPVVITTEKNSVELSLSPGTYRYRIHAFDFLGREARVTEWMDFEVLKASKPEIQMPTESVDLSPDSKTLEFPVEVSDVTGATTVELVNVATGKVIQGTLVGSAEKGAVGSEVARASRAQFKNVPEGEWKLRVTNPSGLASETNPFPVVDRMRIAKAEEKAAEKERKEAEKIAKEEEKQRAAEEKAAEKERVAEEKKAEEEQKKAEKEQKRAEKAAKRIYNDNKVVSVAFGGGIGVLSSDVLKSYNDAPVIPMLNARIDTLPIKKGNNRFGIELWGQFLPLKKQETYYDTELYAGFLQVAAVYRRNFSQSNRLFFQLKAGGGCSVLYKHILYTKDGEQRSDSGKQLFVYPSFGGGISLGYIPVGLFSFELGVDGSYTLIPGMESFFFTPYLSVALRL